MVQPCNIWDSSTNNNNKKTREKKTEEISTFALCRKFMRFGEFSQDQCKLFQRITTTTKTVKFEAYYTIQTMTKMIASWDPQTNSSFQREKWINRDVCLMRLSFAIALNFNTWTKLRWNAKKSWNFSLFSMTQNWVDTIDSIVYAIRKIALILIRLNSKQVSSYIY